MEECKSLIKLINENLSVIEASLRSDRSFLDQTLSKIDRLLSILGNNKLDYVLCALTRQRRKPNTAFLVQKDLQIELGVAKGYGMTNVANEYRSGMCSLDEVLLKINLERVENSVWDSVPGGPEDVVLCPLPMVVFSQSISLENAFVELVFDEYRSFNGVVVCATFRNDSSFYVVDTSLSFSLSVESPIFHCWKCLVNFRGKYSKATLYSGNHFIIPSVHSSVVSRCSSTTALNSVVNISYHMERRAFELKPFSFSPGLPAPVGSKKFLELRYYIAKTDDFSLDYVISDAQLLEMEENKCLGKRASPLVRAHFGDFHRLFEETTMDTGEEKRVECVKAAEMSLDVEALNVSSGDVETDKTGEDREVKKKTRTGNKKRSQSKKKSTNPTAFRAKTYRRS